MKIIAFYLPQYHEIPENDAWWGKGFTEWNNVKKGKPLFAGHYQPRVPLNKNYYDLSDPAVQRWQVDLAKKAGIYGFCYYHYWFNGHLLLEKPAERMLKDPTIDFPFCFCWANEAWTNAWVSSKNTILIEQSYGDEKEWKEHFDYFLPFFKDPRYIKDHNRPVLVIYRPEIIPCLKKMLAFFSEEAKRNGFAGLVLMSQQQTYRVSPHYDPSIFDYEIEYQPDFSGWPLAEQLTWKRKLKNKIILFFLHAFNIDLSSKKKKRLRVKNYDEVWQAILAHHPRPKDVAGAFVDWDNTARRGESGRVINGASPEKFEHYLEEQIRHVKKEYSTDYLFMFAWNEWGECGYLEPDEKWGMDYLDAVRQALEKTK